MHRVGSAAQSACRLHAATGHQPHGGAGQTRAAACGCPGAMPVGTHGANTRPRHPLPALGRQGPALGPRQPGRGPVSLPSPVRAAWPDSVPLPPHASRAWAPRSEEGRRLGPAGWQRWRGTKHPAPTPQARGVYRGGGRQHGDKEALQGGQRMENLHGKCGCGSRAAEGGRQENGALCAPAPQPRSARRPHPPPGASRARLLWPEPSRVVGVRGPGDPEVVNARSMGLGSGFRAMRRVLGAGCRAPGARRRVPGAGCWVGTQTEKELDHGEDGRPGGVQSPGSHLEPQLEPPRTCDVIWEKHGVP